MGSLGPLRITLIFFAAFSIPVLLAVLLGASIIPTRVSLSTSTSLFPRAVVISRPGEVVRIDHSPALLSKADEDFLLVLGLSPAELPALSKRYVVAAKFDRDNLRDGGFGVLLEGESAGTRPMVFWQGAGSADGRWYPFPTSEIRPGEWVLFVLSVQHSRYIGLHEIVYSNEGGHRSRLVGGYDLGDGVIPTSANALLVGDVRQTGFRGAVGLVGVLRGPKLVEQLPSILKSLQRAPREVPVGIPEQNVALWSLEGRDDISPNKHRVRVMGRHGRKRDEGNDR